MMVFDAFTILYIHANQSLIQDWFGFNSFPNLDAMVDHPVCGRLVVTTSVPPMVMMYRGSVLECNPVNSFLTSAYSPLIALWNPSYDSNKVTELMRWGGFSSKM